MSNKSKINQLVSSQPNGIVFQSAWLEQQGYSLSLQSRYKKSQWFKSLGRGALIRTMDQVGYEGAIYALQNQSGLTIHPGGKTALALLGKSHYLVFASNTIVLFGGKYENLPAWFTNHDWGVPIDYNSSSFLPCDIGLVEMEFNNFSIKISGAARAIFECLYLAPERQDLIECYELLEGLNNLNPTKVQELLEYCTSVKVKRLFLYLAEKTGHAWFNQLNLKFVDLGSGKRSIVKHGVYNNKYQITIPKALHINEESDL